MAQPAVNDRPEARETAGEEPFHRHHVGLFFGGVARFEEHEEHSGAALGVEYEYRPLRQWGAGVLVEGMAIGGGRDWALVVPMTWHPWRNFKFSVGPGVEFHPEGNEFLARVSTGYDFHLGRFTVSPEVSGDFTREAQTLVYGVTLGMGF